MRGIRGWHISVALLLLTGCNPIAPATGTHLRFTTFGDGGNAIPTDSDSGMQEESDSGEPSFEDGGTSVRDSGTETLDAGDMSDQDAGDVTDVDAGPVVPICNSKTQFIYTLSQDNTLSTFYPPDLSFRTVGRVNCHSLFATPFSMAVDRNANIWTVFTDGKLYRLDPSNAACTATSFTTLQHGYTTFGMGFSSNTPGSWDETLFVSNSDGSGLAKIDTTTLRLTPIGAYQGLSGSGITGRAELTGTGDAKLYGAFEGAPFEVNEIDKMNAAILSSAPQPGVTTGGSNGSNFAFASWSGVFYLFVGDGTSTKVFKYDPVTTMTTQVAMTTLVIVGAGVSTCAPSGTP